MVRRTTDSAGEAAHQRLKGQMEDVIGVLSDRLDDKFGRLDERLARMENDIGKGALDRGALRSDINETRRDVGELRDAMALQTKVSAPAPTQVASAKKAIHDTVRSPAGIVAAVCIFITTVSAAGGGIPKLVQGAERFWHFLAGREVAAISRPRVEKPAKVSE